MPHFNTSELEIGRVGSKAKLSQFTSLCLVTQEITHFLVFSEKIFFKMLEKLRADSACNIYKLIDIDNAFYECLKDLCKQYN